MTACEIPIPLLQMAEDQGWRRCVLLWQTAEEAASLARATCATRTHRSRIPRTVRHQAGLGDSSL